MDFPGSSDEVTVSRKRQYVPPRKVHGYPLVELAQMIDWDAIDRGASEPFVAKPGRPRLRPRLIAGMFYLQHAFALSDEQVVAGWVENPYWQVFTGERYLQTEPPIDPSSLSCWRTRLGEVGMEELLAQSIEAPKRAQVIHPSSVKRVSVDTTVMPKAIACPTDSALLEKSRVHLVAAVRSCNLHLRQNYNRQAPRLVRQIGQDAHAKQCRGVRSVLRTLRSRVGRVQGDIERQFDRIASARQPYLKQLLERTRRIHIQGTNDKNKLYALHDPEVKCIAKGKVRTPYEFGVKVSIVATLKEGFVVCARSMPGNPSLTSDH